MLGFFGVCQIISVPVASAHHRDFTFLRDWFLPYAGENEIESRTSFVTKDKVFVQEFEFEHGFTDHFAIEPGIEFHGEPGEPNHLDAWDVELRFNFGEFAFNKLLPALNVEYEHPVDSEESDRAELKFILSVYGRDGSDLSFNVNVGQQLRDEKEKEGEFLIGYSRPLTKGESVESGHFIGFRGGFEFMRDFQEHHMLLGPTVSYRPSKEFNILGTVAFPLNHEDENHTQLKLIMEWEF